MPAEPEGAPRSLGHGGSRLHVAGRPGAWSIQGVPLLDVKRQLAIVYLDQDLLPKLETNAA